MSPYLVTGLAAGLLGIALGFGGSHVLDGRVLALEKAAHASDNEHHAEDLAKINAASAKALSDALAKQQAAEGQVASIATKFNDEVAAHASDSLKYRADLAAGTQRVRVRVSGCSVSAPSESTAATGSADAAATYADLDGATASSVFKVAADDQAEIDKFTALQEYVKALQDQGFIGR